ncbi:MAG: ABC transporter permease [Anaerolineae bacterium]|nr:ABC transporter permease [Anaerolineae bacterium]
MRRIWLVVKFELAKTVLRRSFMLTLFLTPLIPFGIMLLYSVVEGEDRNAAPASVIQIIEGEQDEKPEGFVDLSGLIKVLPEPSKERLLQFQSEDEARRALQQEEISAFYILHQDYLESGRITSVRPDFNPLSAVQQSDALKEAILYNLLKDAPLLLERISNPINLRYQYLNQMPARDPQDITTYIIPYIIALVFFIVIFGSASLLLSSVTEEKQNRVLEVLMTSLQPVQMLAGKVVALGLAGLFQVAVWAGIGYSLFGLLGQSSSVLNSFGSLSASLIGWGLIYFLLGFAVYASLMAGLGALVANLREASQATLFIMMPLLAPLMLISVLVTRPNGALAVALSLFPFTAPVTMPMRLAVGAVPVWQIAISIVLLAGASVLVVSSAAGIFRAQNLLSGQTFRIGLFFKALIGKV